MHFPYILFRRLHREGYTEQHTHQEGSVIIIQRSNPDTHCAVFAACRTAFSKEIGGSEYHTVVRVPGKFARVLAFFSLEVSKGDSDEQINPNNSEVCSYNEGAFRVHLFLGQVHLWTPV